jgi:hypothetical protein
MRNEIRHAAKTDNDSRHDTITPWALTEPEQIPVPDPAARKALFGEAQLGCLYSGNLGRAHEFEPFVELARQMNRESPGLSSFCFAGRGPRFAALQKGLEASDTNIGMADFASEESLQERLAAADIHLVSLRPNWTGTVVPSKFFGALAIGRPILFSGSPNSAIAKWIREYNIGWHLTSETLTTVAADLTHYAADADARKNKNQHCFDVYHQHFSKACMMERWAAILRTDSPK